VCLRLQYSTCSAQGTALQAPLSNKLDWWMYEAVHSTASTCVKVLKQRSGWSYKRVRSPFCTCGVLVAPVLALTHGSAAWRGAGTGSANNDASSNVKKRSDLNTRNRSSTSLRSARSSTSIRTQAGSCARIVSCTNQAPALQYTFLVKAAFAACAIYTQILHVAQCVEQQSNSNTMHAAECTCAHSVGVCVCWQCWHCCCCCCCWLLMQAHLQPRITSSCLSVHHDDSAMRWQLTLLLQ
jgi:hypothetical protein